MTYDYLSLNFAPVTGIVFLLIFLRQNSSLDKRIKHIFYALVSLELLEILTYSLELWTSTFEHPTFLRVLLSVIGYIVRPILIYLIVILHLRTNNQKYLKQIAAIPMVVNAVVICSAFFNGWAFYYSADNSFYRGPLGYVPHITLIVCLAFIIILGIKGMHESKSFETFIIVIMALFIVFSIAVETIFDARSIGRTAIVLSTVFYYMFFQTQVYKSTISQDFEIRKALELDSKTDFLSGLLNKKAFEEKVSDILESQSYKSAAFVFVDIDHFKDINDRLGHMIGDHAIVNAAAKLKGIFRHSDILGLFGGDEFCIFLPDISLDILKERLGKAVNVLNEEYTENEVCVKVSASIGAVFISGINGYYHKLLSAADRALYQAKENGRNRFVIHSEG